MDTQERSLEAASHVSADLNNSPNEPRRTVMYTQHDINDGQQNINGALCYVDWHIIEAFEALRDALANSNVLSQQDLDLINEPFDKAYYTSERVAEIIPPGCGTNFPKQP